MVARPPCPRSGLSRSGNPLKSDLVARASLMVVRRSTLVEVDDGAAAD
ncbi:hypothetical protein NX02_05265 [Sphingomonas sanxanigenens DSM 19645 = NX02]|uniref:Uncharacterized protein n=1 Tax=Sphingomonas sanxanigenens DSM 19645 = NX02 TaxID=1123269 RepID=W0A8X3_9SPHN|nr:hypothetical protein NX02_05265 [Sphingomonas sanxanigenens DSM 19645 = NX02]